MLSTTAATLRPDLDHDARGRLVRPILVRLTARALGPRESERLAVYVLVPVEGRDRRVRRYIGQVALRHAGPATPERDVTGWIAEDGSGSVLGPFGTPHAAAWRLTCAALPAPHAIPA